MNHKKNKEKYHQTKKMKYRIRARKDAKIKQKGKAEKF